MKKLVLPFLAAVLCLLSLPVFAQADEDTSALGLPGDNLDLYAVMDLFQKSKTIEDFEKALNNQQPPINNLDLDMDKKVDFIKVVTKKKDASFAFVLQIDVSKTEAQDVAVILVDKDKAGKVSLQIVGDEKLYGKNYVIEPKTTTPGVTPNPAYTGSEPVKVAVPAQTTVIVEQVPIVQYVYSPAYVPYVPPYYYGFPPPYFAAAAFTVMAVGIYRHNNYYHHGGYHGGHYGGHNNVVINNNNNFNNYNNNKRTSNSVSNNMAKGNYQTGDRGANRGNAGAGGARPSQTPSNRPSNGASNRPSAGTSDRPGGSDRPSAGTSDRPGGTDRPGGSDRPSAGTSDRPGGADRANNPSASTRPSTSDRSAGGPSAGTSDRSGGRSGGSDFSGGGGRSMNNGGGGSRGGGGNSGGFSGGGGSRGGGGFSGGGGGRGGGGGGGGRRR